jgi:hypothetical protein
MASGYYLRSYFKRSSFVMQEIRTSNPEVAAEEVNKNANKLMKTLCNEMLGQMPDKGKWTNHYTSTVVSFAEAMARGEKRQFGERDPLTPTPEAGFPHHIHEGFASIHVPGNVIPVEECLNFSKHHFVPGVLQLA